MDIDQAPHEGREEPTMTYNPDALQAECPECAALFEGPARGSNLADHYDREHSDDAVTERAHVAADAADELLGWCDQCNHPRHTDSESCGKLQPDGMSHCRCAVHAGCAAGDPCPHPNLQPLESERMKLLRSGGPVFLTSGDVDPEPPAPPVDWQPDWQPSVWGPLP